MPLQAHHWNDSLLPLDTTARSRTIALLPLGAHEQHGPHLPFDTDTLIAEGIARRVMEAVPAHAHVVRLPTESVGYSLEHMDVPGSRTLGYDEAINRWLGIAEDLSTAGVRKFVMLNAHGGNSPLMTIVATEARTRFGVLAVATSWTRFGQPDGWMPPEAKAIDIHGGDIETSVMLALHPDKVDMDKAENFSSRQTEFAARFKHLRAYGSHAFGWKMSDINPQGVAGDAKAATAERGKQLIAHAVNGIIELLEDIDGFDMEIFNAVNG